MTDTGGKFKIGDRVQHKSVAVEYATTWIIKSFTRSGDVFRYYMEAVEGPNSGGVAGAYETDLRLAPVATVIKAQRPYDVITFNAWEMHLRRSERWHEGDINNWTLSDWGLALGGETGEYLNAVKKLRRIQTGADSIDTATGEPDTRSEYRLKVAAATELADIIAYVIVNFAALGFTYDEAQRIIANKFNVVSATYNFPERLEIPDEG